MTRYTDKDGEPVRLKKDGTPDRRSPPEEHQFKKGKSGNPSGRPKGKASLQTAVQKALATKAKVRLGGQDVEIPMMEAIALALAHKGVKGDPRAFAELIKHLPDDRPPGVEDTPEKEAARQRMIRQLEDLMEPHFQLRELGITQNKGDLIMLPRWVYEEYARRENEGLGHGPIDVPLSRFREARKPLPPAGGSGLRLQAEQ